MTPLQAYLLYSSVHMHFTSKGYDYFKYNGKTKLTQESFEKLSNKYPYAKIAQHKDPKGLLVSNHVYREVKWVGDLFDDEGDNCFSEYVKYNKAQGYHYKQELQTVLRSIDGDLNTLLRPADGALPPLVILLLKKQVRYETVTIMNDVLNFIPMWERRITDNIMWPKIGSRLLKMRPFYQFDKLKLKEVTKEVCLNNKQED